MLSCWPTEASIEGVVYALSETEVTRVANRDVSHLIERLEAFEDRLGVSLEGLYAAQDTEYGQLEVNGELHPREGTEIDQDLEVVATLYDSAGRVIGVTSERIYSDRFFGFEAFSAYFGEVSDPPVAKIRIYPKAR